jgi:hypothetical protein
MNRNLPDVPARPGTVHALRKLSGAAAEASGREYPYSPQERAEVLALAEEVGDQAAAEQRGVSAQLISQWRTKAKRDLRAARAAYLDLGGREKDGAVLEAPDWRKQRVREANEAGLDARIVRDTATQAMLDGNWQLVKAGAAYYIALTDRAQLLTAGRMPVPKTPEEARQEVERMVQTLRERAAARAQEQEGEAS